MCSVAVTHMQGCFSNTEITNILLCTSKDKLDAFKRERSAPNEGFQKSIMIIRNKNIFKMITYLSV